MVQQSTMRQEDTRKRRLRHESVRAKSRRPPPPWLFRNLTAVHWSLVGFILVYMLATLRVTTWIDNYAQQRRITTAMDNHFIHQTGGDEPLAAAPTAPVPISSHMRGQSQKRDPWRPQHSALVSFQAPFLAPSRAATNNIVNSTVVVFVLSKYDRFRQRQVIRTTWAQNKQNVYFIIGHPPRNNCSGEVVTDCALEGDMDRALIEQQLHDEQTANSDLVEIPIEETYRTLPEKVIQAYDWTMYHFPSVQWLVKVDDDMYCRVDALALYLQRFNAQQHIVLGDMQAGSQVWRTGKWAEEEYEASEYPLFPLGSAGHVISQRTAGHLVQHGAQLHRYQGEDTSLGIWMDESNLPDRIYINTHSMFRIMGIGGASPCGVSDVYMVGHNLTTAEMKECHGLFVDSQATDSSSLLWTDRPARTHSSTGLHMEMPSPNSSRTSPRKHRKPQRDSAERTCWILLVAAILMFYNRKNAASLGALRYVLYIAGTVLVIHIATEENELHPLSTQIPRLYVCGWTVSEGSAGHIARMFPFHKYIPLTDSPPTESRQEDVLVTSEGYGPQCNGVWRSHASFSTWAVSFRGKILLRNGENHTVGSVEGRPGQVYELGYVHDNEEHMRFRYVQTVLLEYGPEAWRTLFVPEKKPKSKGTRFLIYAQHQCHDHREQAFDLLSSIDVVDFGGFCSGTGKNSSRVRAATDVVSATNSIWTENSELFSSYRFCLVMENTNPAIDGYITEKILNAFLAGCIPIYWGPTEVFKMFNKNAFVFYDVENPEPALEEVRILETNQRAYDAKQDEHILAAGNLTIEEYFSFTTEYGDGKLAKRLHRFLQLPWPEVLGS